MKVLNKGFAFWFFKAPIYKSLEGKFYEIIYN